MRPARLLLAAAVILAGIGLSVFLIGRDLGSLQGLKLSSILTTTTPQARRAAPQRHRAAADHGRHRAPGRKGARHAATPAQRGFSFDYKPLLVVALEIAGGFALMALLAMLLVARRLALRHRRKYSLYELHLSTHDEAKPQDLEDMVEAIANIIRVFPGERIRSGQPYVALELICGAGADGVEWSLNIRCEPRSVRALDGAIASAYPDVRIGHRHEDLPTPRTGTLRKPGAVMRFRKERPFVYSLIAGADLQASPPLEQIARAQTELGTPSIVRFQLIPTVSFFEELARRRYRRHEGKLMRQERWSLPDGGLWSTFSQAEMRASLETQNRSLFWLEVVVAAETMQACKTVAAAVQSRRGENRLHRRLMVLRRGLYRRRFPHARGPLIPSLRSLVSGAEAAHLLALPTARMKGVPVRRVTLPRIPAPPDAVRGSRPRRVPAGGPEPASAPGAAEVIVR